MLETIPVRKETGILTFLLLRQVWVWGHSAGQKTSKKKPHDGCSPHSQTTRPQTTNPPGVISQFVQTMALQPFHHLCSSKARVRQFLTGKKKPKQGKAIFKKPTIYRKLQTLRQNFQQEAQLGICLRCQPGGGSVLSSRAQHRLLPRVTCHQVSHMSRCSSTPSARGAMRTRKFWSRRGGGYLSQAARCSTHLCLRAQLPTKAKPQLKAAFPSNREEK